MNSQKISFEECKSELYNFSFEDYSELETKPNTDFNRVSYEECLNRLFEHISDSLISGGSNDNTGGGIYNQHQVSEELSELLPEAWSIIRNKSESEKTAFVFSLLNGFYEVCGYYGVKGAYNTAQNVISGREPDDDENSLEKYVAAYIKQFKENLKDRRHNGYTRGSENIVTKDEYLELCKYVQFKLRESTEFFKLRESTEFSYIDPGLNERANNIRKAIIDKFGFENVFFEDISEQKDSVKGQTLKLVYVEALISNSINNRINNNIYNNLDNNIDNNTNTDNNIDNSTN